tara:strand:- start:86439 stop:86642 length:204 start_codon:yes stop_codon:yes gene_type:complete
LEQKSGSGKQRIKKRCCNTYGSGRSLKNVNYFFIIDQNLQKEEKPEVVVMRNQVEKILSIKTKYKSS